LFNTLNNIRASILENPEKARASIAQLADMLRYTLQDYKQSRVPLHIELKVVDEFIELCKIQYEDRLQFQVNVEEVTKTALIPRLLLQLCTENAIKHGIAKLKTGGVISLDISVYNSKYIQIQMHNPVMNSRYSDLAQNAPAPLNIGVGLKNIRERLSLLYGKTHSNNYNFNFRVHENTAQLIITIPLEYT
jgi:LytS/YehU family sensor histidine kinase